MMPRECTAGFPVCCHEEGKGLTLSIVAAGYRMDPGCGGHTQLHVHSNTTTLVTQDGTD